MRLDKLLSQDGEHTRSEARRMIRAGLCRVNGEVARDAGLEVGGARVELEGRAVEDARFQYYLLYKPAGVLTAATDRHARTVMELLPEKCARRGVLPVGRLDKDTTGALLLTNDGELAHRLLAPKRHVEKEYRAAVDGVLTEADVEAFAAGIELKDFCAKPARMRVEGDGRQATVWLTEGKFHQVKRMFGARGREVIRLHRAAFGPLRLDGMAEGDYRELEEAEVAELYRAAELGKAR